MANPIERAGVIGSYVNVDSANMMTSDVTKATTTNLGNMMFRYAVCRDIGDFERIETAMSPAEVREKVDVLVLPMANNVNPFFDMGYMASFIEACDLPVVVVGLGAQAPLGASMTNDLPAGSVRFLQVCSERATSIGVRGPFTASVLEELGVSNAIVTGCPSNFINPKVNLGATLEGRRRHITRHEPARVAVYSQLGHDNFRAPNIASERQLFELVRSHNYHYIHNFPAELIDYSRGAKEVNFMWMSNMRRHMVPKESFESFDRVFRRQSHAFLSVEAWMEFSSTCDISIGKRVHGCLNTIQAGTFGILIYHDERTRELAETLNLPRLSIQDVEPDDDIPSFIDKATFSGRDYDSTRRKLFTRYSALLEAAGLVNGNALLEQGFIENEQVEAANSAEKSTPEAA